LAELPTSGRVRVLVASDQRLVADTVQVALTSQGHEVVVTRWSNDARGLPRRRPQAGGSLVDVGLLICELDRWSRLDVAVSIVARTGLPWLALTSAPRGPAWGALVAAGAELVLSVETGLDSLGDLLGSVGLRKRATPADERTELEAAWEEARSHRRTVVERVGRLSAREGEVLRLAYEGCSVAQIADALGVAAPTVRSWTASLLHKLEVSTELAAVATFRSSLDELDTRTPDRSYGRRPPADLVCHPDGR
jgi:DNA-binding NarL/FixJ family response regulator